MCVFVRQRKLSYRRNFSSFRTVGFNLKRRPPCRYSARPNMCASFQLQMQTIKLLRRGKCCFGILRGPSHCLRLNYSHQSSHVIFHILKWEHEQRDSLRQFHIISFCRFSLRLAHYSSSFCRLRPLSAFPSHHSNGNHAPAANRLKIHWCFAVYCYSLIVSLENWPLFILMNRKKKSTYK